MPRIFCLLSLFLFPTALLFTGCSNSGGFTAAGGGTIVAAESVVLDGKTWSLFHGPNRDNVSPETGLLKSWEEGGPPLLWKVNNIGTTGSPGYASVTVAEGRVFTAGNVRTGTDDQQAHSYVFALDENTGNELWRYRNGPAWVAGNLYPGERGTPTIDGGRVYAYSSVGRIACIEAATGKEIWAKDLREEYTVTLPTWAFAESPFIDGNKVILWVGGEKASVVALDKMTGAPLWTTPSTGQRGNYASMIAFDYAGQRIYVNMNQTGVLAVQAETGKQLFDIPHKTEWDVMATTPYFFMKVPAAATSPEALGYLLVVSGYGTGARCYQLNVSGDTITPHLHWSNPEFDNMHGGMVVKDGYAYTATHYYKRQRNWSCINIETGEVVWEAPGVGMGSLTCADGMLFCMSERDPVVALVKASPEGYEELGRFELPAPEEGGGTGMSWAHPVVCNKKLYLRHGSVLYCYDVGEK